MMVARVRRYFGAAGWALSIVAVAAVVAIILANVITLRGENEDLRKDVTTLAGQVKSLGATPAVSTPEPGTAGPRGDKGDTGDRGAQGPPGIPGPAGPPPSADQVRTAVAAYLAANPPAAGKNATPDQIAQAVAMYCATGVCRGGDGADGATGPAGADGQSITGPQGAAGPPGPAGPAPSDDQVAGAVAAFCAAHNGCVGATGATGPVGPAVGSFSFTFGITEYDCSDPDQNGAYTCTGTTPPP